MRPTVFELEQGISFSASHALREGGREDEALHAHTWRIVVCVRASHLDPCGFVMDFRALDAILRTLVEPFEGRALNDVPPFDTVNPTAEALAIYAATSLALLLRETRVHLYRVQVFKDAHTVAYYPGAARP